MQQPDNLQRLEELTNVLGFEDRKMTLWKTIILAQQTKNS